jgi:hypothetical protein
VSFLTDWAVRRRSNRHPHASVQGTPRRHRSDSRKESTAPTMAARTRADSLDPDAWPFSASRRQRRNGCLTPHGAQNGTSVRA